MSLIIYTDKSVSEKRSLIRNENLTKCQEFSNCKVYHLKAQSFCFLMIRTLDTLMERFIIAAYRKLFEKNQEAATISLLFCRFVEMWKSMLTTFYDHTILVASGAVSTMPFESVSHSMEYNGIRICMILLSY